MVKGHCELQIEIPTQMSHEEQLRITLSQKLWKELNVFKSAGNSTREQADYQ